MNISALLTFGSKQFLESPTPLLDSQILLAHILKKRKEYLFTHDQEELSKSRSNAFLRLVNKRRQGMPIAYLTHEKEFFGRKFFVDERVIIPRPETELMVEDALQYLQKNPDTKTIVDLGTGSGCIGITIALELFDRQVIGLDISKDALAVARKNAKKLQCKNVSFLRSDLLSKFSIPTKPEGRMEESLSRPFARNGKLIILANLPYIGTKTNHFISRETHRFEPHVAVYGGHDGLELYRQTWQQIIHKKLNVAALFMEIGFSQKETLEKEIKAQFPESHLQIKEDLAGFPRTAILYPMLDPPTLYHTLHRSKH